MKKIKLSQNARIENDQVIHKKYGHSVFGDLDSPLLLKDKESLKTLALLDLIQSDDFKPSNLIKTIPRTHSFFDCERRFLFNELHEERNSSSILILSLFHNFQKSQWKYFDYIAANSSTLFDHCNLVYDPKTNTTYSLNVPVYDCGNIDIFCSCAEKLATINDIYSSFVDTKKIPFTFGGTHETSYFILKNLIQVDTPINLIIFDAHLDLGPTLNNKFIHCGNWVTSLLKDYPNINIFYYGVRDLESNFKTQKKIYINQPLPNNNHPTYISIDVDYFDPCYISSVAYPTPGGYSLLDFTKTLDQINFSKVIGLDIVEYLSFYNKEHEHTFINQIMFELIKRCAK